MQQKLTNIIPEHCNLLLITDENQKYRLLNILQIGLNLDKKEICAVVKCITHQILQTKS